MPADAPDEEHAGEEADIPTRCSYSDGSRRWIHKETRASWAVVSLPEADPDEGTHRSTPTPQEQRSGRLTGPPFQMEISRAELMGLREALVHCSVAQGSTGRAEHHMDRKATLQTAERLQTISRREFLNLSDKDIWEEVKVWTEHLAGRVTLHKVQAHVERIHPPRQRSRHEWGNHFADIAADMALRQDSDTTGTGNETTAAIRPSYRTERWRLFDSELGFELTMGLRNAIVQACQRAAHHRDKAARIKEHRAPRPQMDPRFNTTITSQTLRTQLWGPKVVAVNTDDKGDEGDTPLEWAHIAAGHSGGGKRHYQAQQTKFLHAHLFTQHVQERRCSPGTHSACKLCNADGPANNDHMLFACTHLELQAARASWAEAVTTAWTKESDALPTKLVKAAHSLWQLEGGSFPMPRPRDDPHPPDDSSLIQQHLPQTDHEITARKALWRGIWGPHILNQALDWTREQHGTNAPPTETIILALARIAAVTRTEWRQVWRAHNKLTHRQQHDDWTPQPGQPGDKHRKRSWQRVLQKIRAWIKPLAAKGKTITREVREALHLGENYPLHLRATLTAQVLEAGKVPTTSRAGSIAHHMLGPKGKPTGQEEELSAAPRETKRPRPTDPPYRTQTTLHNFFHKKHPET